MSFYHQTTRGWLAHKLSGKQWILLGAFLLFYAGLLFYGESLRPETQVADTHQLMEESRDDFATHQKYEDHDSFLGLP